MEKAGKYTMRGLLRLGILVTGTLFVLGFMAGAIHAYATAPSSGPLVISTQVSPTATAALQVTTATILMSPQASAFAFSPATQTIKVGSTVQWQNTTSVPHTVVGFGKDAGLIPSGKTFSYTFTQAGTFSYVCSYHPGMTGTIIVVP